MSMYMKSFLNQFVSPICELIILAIELLNLQCCLPPVCLFQAASCHATYWWHRASRKAISCLQKTVFAGKNLFSHLIQDVSFETYCTVLRKCDQKTVPKWPCLKAVLLSVVYILALHTYTYLTLVFQSSGKSDKAKLISRMAKMGQPMLPMVGAMAQGQEEEEEVGKEQVGSFT